MIERFSEYRAALFLFVLLFLIFPVRYSAAQSAVRSDTTRVRGIVVDAETGDPIMGVHIFYAGTTIGDASDADGSFSLPLPPTQQISLVASMIGFKLIEEDLDLRIYRGAPYLFKLKSITFDLEGIAVLGDSDHAWRTNLRRFKDIIFGDTEFGDKCEIENPENLDFTFQLIQDNLFATSSGPVIVNNDALGYTIELHGFELTGREQNFTWKGQPVFVEMEGTDKQRRVWSKNRQRAYNGSQKHFITSLYAGTLKKEGFGAYHVAEVGFSSTANPIAELRGDDYDREKFTPVMSGNVTDPTRQMEFIGTLLVIYNKEDEPDDYIEYANRLRSTNARAILNQSSWMELPFTSVTTDKNGNVLNDSVSDPVKVFGYWAWERVGEWLPSDYSPILD